MGRLWILSGSYGTMPNKYLPFPVVIMLIEMGVTSHNYESLNCQTYHYTYHIDKTGTEVSPKICNLSEM